MSINNDSRGRTSSDPRSLRLRSFEDFFFATLAFPILVGPGTITTLILYAHHISKPMDAIIYAGVFLVVLFLLFITFWNASALAKRLSDNARVIMSRFMGMILSAIAISMIADGLKVLLPGLA